jgi:hypothetical protein
VQLERKERSVDETVLPYLNEERCIFCITLLEIAKTANSRMVPVCLEICRNKFCPDRNNIKTHYNNSNHNNHDDSITFFKCFFFQITTTNHNCETEYSSHKTCFEKHWKENVDYFKVEHPIVCHDGESIQVRI